MIRRIFGHVDGQRQDDAGRFDIGMVRSVAGLVSFGSSRVRLEPADIVETGAPEDVGTFQDIQLYSGDKVGIWVEGVGALRNEVEAGDN